MNDHQDLVDLLKEKQFLGKEFLTWAWFRSELEGGAFKTGDGQEVLISFEQFMVLESGDGDASETVTCRGLSTDLSEARSALRKGKKVSRAHIRLSSRNNEWKLNINGTTFDISGLRTPKGIGQGEDESDDLAMEARILERGALVEEAIGLIDSMFQVFLSIRTQKDAWETEKKRLREWIWRE